MKLSGEAMQSVKSISLGIKVLRADGTVKKDYGVVACWFRNPLKRWAWRLGRLFS